MPDYKMKIYLYDVTPEHEKEVFAEVLKIVQSHEGDFYINVLNDTVVESAERYEQMTTDEFVREFEEKKDVPGD